MNLYEQQAANRRKTWLIMPAFVLFLFFIGAGFDGFVIGRAGGSVPVGQPEGRVVVGSVRVASTDAGASLRVEGDGV